MSDEFCPRLLDYIVVVGSHYPSRANSNSQVPVILNRFPPTDHSDFILPTDVALFCQPDGGFDTSCRIQRTHFDSSLPKHTPISFVFTLTDKESGKVRYGICLNFFRPVPGRFEERLSDCSSSSRAPNVSDKTTDFEVSRPASSRFSENRSDKDVNEKETVQFSNFHRYRAHTLTSLCLLSHHPFFTRFRALVEFLHMLIQKLHERCRLKHTEKDTVWNILAGTPPTSPSPSVVRSVQEIETWILRLLSAPAPIPGKTCVHLFVQPRSFTKPLMFALPDKSRLPLVDIPLHLPIQLLGISRTLRILVCLLLEQKVVLQSSDYNKLSVSVLALTALLYPLQYMFPVIPLLPPCMPDAEQLLIAPTPYLIGVPTSFYTTRKVFRMPKDVWVANLDTQQLSYPEVLEALPDLPETECHDLVKQMNEAIQTLPSIKESPPLELILSELNRLMKTRTAKLQDFNPLAYISEEASVSVATRVAMILFLNSKNILGGLAAHTRTLRLYPRPVVAFQFESFMKSRPHPCLFTSMLAKTQAVEYFAESTLCAENDAYQRIVAGEYAPEVIGDKAEWFAPLLSAVQFDVWPDTAESNSSRTSFSGEFSRSPLLSALVAARLHLASLAGVKDKAAEEQTSSSKGHLSPSLGLTDEASDYPTDESASDTETEHSTASITSTASDLASDYFDSGIGESQHRLRTADDSSDRVRDSSDLSVTTSDQTSPVLEPLIVTPGEPLPPGLQIHFNPPFQPVYGSAVTPDDERIAQVDVISDDPGQENEAGIAEQRPHASSKVAETRSNDFSTTQTFRTIRKISMTMFNDNSTIAYSDNSQGKQSGINWGSPFFLLLGELFNMNSSDMEKMSRSGELSKMYKRRVEDERYLLSVAKTIKEGNIPGFFSRNRVISMLESESHRNLLLSQLNEGNMNSAHNSGMQSYIEDVTLESWNQYKALVWILQQITLGLELSMHSDIFIPTPSNFHMEAALQRSGRSATPPVQPNNGGLASAFILLELAHTHFFPLPIRQDRSSKRGLNSNGYATLSRVSLSSTALSAHSDARSLAPSESASAISPPTEISRSNTPTGSLNSKFDLSPTSVDAQNSLTPVQRRSADPDKPLSSPRSPILVSPTVEKLKNRSPNSPSLSTVSAASAKTATGGSPLVPKSSRTRGFRYVRSRLTKVDPTNILFTPSLVNHRHSLGERELEELQRQSDSPKPPAIKFRTGRTYLFEDLITDTNRKNKLWDDMQFWEDAFLDAVAQERDILGMDFRPADLLERYNSANPLKRKHLELEEDRLLASLMHNLIAFMVMVDVSLPDIRKKVRRLLAKSHMGLHYSQEISHLLDVLEYLAGNDIDLKVLQSRSIPLRSHEVRWGTDEEGELVYMEVCDDCLLLRTFSGAVLDRWWFDQLINITHRPQTHILGIALRTNGQSHLNLFYTKRCQELYQEIKKAVEQASLQTPRGPLVADLGGDINVVCLGTHRPGTVRLFPDGFAFTFGNRRKFISIPNIKRCSAPQSDVFTIDYYDQKKKCLCSEKFQTDVASHLLYYFHVMISNISASMPATPRGLRSRNMSSVTLLPSESFPHSLCTLTGLH